MSRRFFYVVVFVLLSFVLSAHSWAMSSVPDALYPDLEYLFSLSRSAATPAPGQLANIIAFVRSAPAETSMSMKDRDKATGAFHAFSVRGDLSRVVDYVYNPDIPLYVTMPSSVREQEWLNQSARAELRKLPQALRDKSFTLVRGSEREVITPDANTGGYYTYRQDRVVAFLTGPDNAPVLISVSCQPEPSDVGRKGCVVGEDANWNYLYSDETGLTKTGLGWVDSYMYNAYSALVYVADPATGVVRVGSFKWLNAGWAKMNMVKPSHILNGIKRFASDFKAVLESPGLPGSAEIADKYRSLTQANADSLRQMVAPYVTAISQSGDPKVTTGPFKNLLASGQYLQNMSHQEMVKVLLQEYVKAHIGKETLVHVAAAEKKSVASVQP